MKKIFYSSAFKKIKDFKTSSFDSTFFSCFVLLFFIASSLYFFSTIFFGLDFSDGFYHLNQASADISNPKLITHFLSPVIVDGITNLFGKNLLILRFINALLLFLSIFLPFMVNGINPFRKRILLSISCALIIFTPLNANILGYDTLTVFFICLIFSILVRYLRSPNFILLVFLGVLTAASTFIRIPNLLLVFIVGVIIAFREKAEFWSNEVKKGMAFSFITLTLIIVGYLYYINLNAGQNLNSITTEHHTIRKLFLNYIQDFLFILSIILFTFLPFVFYNFLKPQLRICVWIIYGLVGVVFLFKFVLFSKYSGNYALLITAMSFSFIIWQIGKKSGINFYKTLVILFGVLFFITPAGSNTGLIKSSFLFLLFPFILYESGIKVKRKVLLILMAIIPFSFLEKITSVYEDDPVYNLNYQLNSSGLNPVLTNKTRGEFVGKINNEISRLKKTNTSVAIYGNKSHIFAWLNSGVYYDEFSFFQPVENLFRSQFYKEEIANLSDVAIFIFESYPNQRPNDNFKLEEILAKKGYNKIKMDSFTYFLKKSDNNEG